jgi:hypothetical protein
MHVLLVDHRHFSEICLVIACLGGDFEVIGRGKLLVLLPEKVSVADVIRSLADLVSSK